jgi:hypothetical protein
MLVGDAELNALLFGECSTLVNVKCFVGEGAFTEDDLRGELKSALKQRADGSARVSDSFGDDAPKVDVRALLASLQ